MSKTDDKTAKEIIDDITNLLDDLDRLRLPNAVHEETLESIASEVEVRLTAFKEETEV